MRGSGGRTSAKVRPVVARMLVGARGGQVRHSLVHVPLDFFAESLRTFFRQEVHAAFMLVHKSVDSCVRVFEASAKQIRDSAARVV